MEELCPRCLLILALDAGEPPSGDEWTPSASELTTQSHVRSESLKQVGPYKLLTTLGEGGMGVVYLAEQQEPIRRRVALKVIKRGMDSKEVIARFESERQALALMSHPGISKVFDAGTTGDGLPYFVMEHVPGLPITEYCDRNRLSSRERLELFIEVCDAVQHAHTKGVIHRDIKPSNVLVSEVDGKPRPKMIDFGVAKAVNQRLTEKSFFTNLGVMIGTPGYMSPEQSDLTSLDVDTRSDTYSLGVLAYELLVGATPFDPKRLREAGWAEMQRIIREEEPPKPSTRLTTLGQTATDVAKRRRSDPLKLAREITGDLDWITLKALEKDRTRRYPSASELAGDIRRYLNDEPVSAGPPDLSYRLRKAIRRHKVVFVAATAVLTAILAGLVVSMALYFRAEAARRQTRREVVRLNVATGMRLVDEGDRVTALPWLVEALRLEEDAHRREAHRYRIGTTLAQLPALCRFWGHSGRVFDAVFSNDGRAVATASEDRTARVWSVVTGEALSPPLQHEGTVTSVAFDSVATRLVTGSLDGRARIWDASSGRALAVMKHEAPVYIATFSPDGVRVVTASVDRTARLWDAAAGRQLATVHHGGTVNWARFSPDGQTFLTASTDGTARLWDVNGRPRTPPLTHMPSSSVNIAAFSPNGRKIATAGSDWMVRLWEAATGTALTPPLRHGNPVSFVAFSPDGYRLVTAAMDGAARVWDVEAGTLAFTLRLDSNPAVAAFSPDGLLIATAEEGGQVRLWNAATGAALGAPLHHAGWVSSVAFEPTGRFLLSAGLNDGTVRVWDLATTETTRPPLVHAEQITKCGFSPNGRSVFTSVGIPFRPDSYARLWDSTTGDPITPPLRVAPGYADADLSADGRTLATGSGDGKACLWSVAEGEPLGPPLLHDSLVARVLFSPDGGRLLTGTGTLYESRPGLVRLWDISTRKEIFPPLKHEGAVMSAAFTRDGRCIMTGADGGVARIWDASSGASLSAPLQNASAVLTLAVSPDGTRLATTSTDNSLRLWRVPGGEPDGAFVQDSQPTAVRFSPDGTKLATGCRGGTVRLWHVRTGQALGAPMPHKGFVYDVPFSSDQRWLVTASLDHTARIWDAETGEPVTPPYEHGDAVWGAALAPDGRRLLTCSQDRTARIWDFARDDRPVEDLQALAHLLAGRRILDTTGVATLGPRELEGAWLTMKSRYPETLTASPSQLFAWHRAKADTLAANGRWREAIAHLDAALVAGPRSWRLLVDRGRAQAELGLWDRAGTDFGAALTALPGEIEVAYDLALVRVVKGDLAGYDDLRTQLVDRWSQTRNPDRARWAAHAMVLTPIESAAAQALAVTWAATALETEPERSERLALHGATLFRAGRFEAAARELEKAIGKEGGKPSGWTAAFRAMTLRHLNRPAEASPWLATAFRELRGIEHGFASPASKPGQDSKRPPTMSWAEREELRLLVAEARQVRPGVGAGAKRVPVP